MSRVYSVSLVRRISGCRVSNARTREVASQVYIRIKVDDVAVG
jgi:hypothetical protein